MLSFYAISSLVNGLTSTALGLFVLFKNKHDIKHRSYFAFSLSVAIWSYCYFFWQVSTTASDAIFYCRLLMVAAIFIPVLYLHHLLSLLERTKTSRLLLFTCYTFVILSLIAAATPYFVSSVDTKLSFRFWPEPGFLFHPFLIVWIALVIYTEYTIIKCIKLSHGRRRLQMQYLLIGTSIGYGGGLTNFFLWYDVPIPPVGNIAASFYVVITTIAIIRHQLMDIDVIVKRTLVFAGMFGMIMATVAMVTMLMQDWVGRFLEVGTQTSMVLSGIILINIINDLKIASVSVGFFKTPFNIFAMQKIFSQVINKDAL